MRNAPGWTLLHVLLTKKMMKSVVFAFLLVIETASFEQCSVEDGGGSCPDGNTCCSISLDHKEGFSSGGSQQFSSGCITHLHVDGLGECCTDDMNINIETDENYSRQKFRTGCGAGFQCASSWKEDGTRSFFCQEIESQTIAHQQPRYTLVPSSKEIVGDMYGFPITSSSHILPYYSTMGPVLTHPSATSNLYSQIKVVLIIIHGSARNADDYVYSGLVASKLQTVHPPENVLVISPRFLVPADGHVDVSLPSSSNNVKYVDQKDIMRWEEKGPISHTWRYGANALHPSQDISSYDAMDAIVEHFALNSNEEDDSNKYCNLEKIIVAGHSAGGQFVHRWALTSNSPAWGEGNEYGTNINTNGIKFETNGAEHGGGIATTHLRRANEDNTPKQRQKTKLPSIRVVAANPRSFCYLDGRRFVQKSFQIPNDEAISSCPGYDQWEWGLQPGGRLFTPYLDRALDAMHGDVTKLAKRYASRDVYYLSGDNDTERLKSTCEPDEFQGAYRRERSELYFESLRLYFGKPVHRRLVVEGVGHDHSLMFESEAGLEALFG